MYLLRYTLFCILFATCVHAEYTTIIFDFGGVILDRDSHYILNNHAYNSAIRESQAWRNWMKGIITKDELINILSKRFDKDEVMQLINSSLSPHRPYIQETIDIIPKLKQSGYHIYLLSNISYDARKQFIDNTEIAHLFDGIVCSCDVGHTKPEQEIYQRLLHDYGLAAEECIFIDDLIRNVLGAHKVGITAFAFQKGKIHQLLSEHGIHA